VESHIRAGIDHASFRRVSRATEAALGPALLLENKLEQATGKVRARLEALAKDNTGSVSAAAEQLLDAGVREFRSSRGPSQAYLVTFGRGGHLECTCEGFKWRDNCKHVREVRAASWSHMGGSRSRQ